MLKRAYACIISSALIAAALSGCGADSQELEITGKDYRVTPEHIVEITGDENVDSSTRMPDYIFLPTLESLADVSNYIVEGEIVELYYTVCERNAWIQMDVLISDCQKGGFEQGDIISVYTSGGYISAADHFSEEAKEDYYSDVPDEVMENTIIKVLNNGAPLPEKGEKYMFFMDNGGSTRPAGCYEVMMSYEVGMFGVQDQMYVNNNTDESFSKEEMETVLLNLAAQ
jgi:hypothetical protein